MPPDWNVVNELDEIAELKTKVEQLENIIDTLKGQIGGQVVNKDGLPLDLNIHAEVDDLGEVWLRTNKNNYQIIQIGVQEITQGKRFKSLSAAAEFFSKVKRKSGWVYWRTTEGRTLKDAYKG